MNDVELLARLVDNPGVPQEAKMAYSAGYFEGLLLSLMAQFPEVRDEVEVRLRQRSV